MQLKPEQLDQHLSSTLLPCYFVSGDEPYFHLQSCEKIRNAAKANGFSERHVYHVEAKFDWNSLVNQSNSMSLFSEKQLIEIRLQKAGFDREASKIIRQLVTSDNPDVCLLISSPKISGQHKKSAWFRDIDSHGASIQVWPLDARAMERWLSDYARQQSLNLSQDAIEFLCYKNQANALAAAQEVDKLCLQFEADTPIDSQMIAGMLNQNSQFTVFDLSHSFVCNQRELAQLQLTHLREEGTHESSILWALMRDLRLVQQLQSNTPANVFQKSGYIPRNQQQNLSNAAQRSSQQRLSKLFAIGLEIDKAIKGQSTQDPWCLLSRFLLY